MNNPIETQIQPPLVTGAERPYTLADACLDHAKRILIHADTCPAPLFALQKNRDFAWPQVPDSIRVACKNCGGAEPLPLMRDYEEAWLLRAQDETALIKAKIVSGDFGAKAEG